MDTENIEGIEATRKVVGELLPVLTNKKGIVIDGRHRRQANPNWRTETVDLDDLRTVAARLVMNAKRRVASKEDYDECANELLKNESGKDSSHVKSGKTYAERISELTGIHYTTFIHLLDEKFKGKYNKKDIESTYNVDLGEGKQVQVPEKLIPEVKQFIETKKTEAVAIAKFKDDVKKLPKLTVKQQEAAEKQMKATQESFAKNMDAFDKQYRELVKSPLGQLGKNWLPHWMVSGIYGKGTMKCPKCGGNQLGWLCCKFPLMEALKMIGDEQKKLQAKRSKGGK